MCTGKAVVAWQKDITPHYSALLSTMFLCRYASSDMSSLLHCLRYRLWGRPVFRPTQVLRRGFPAETG